MEFVKSEWTGKWDNFEDYIDSTEQYMVLAWNEAEESLAKMEKKIPMFANGAKVFWQKACSTVTAENPYRISGCQIKEEVSRDGLEIEWFSEKGSLGKYHYYVEKIIERGLEGKENYLFCSCDAPKGSPFCCLLAMPPMPERRARMQGGYLSHFHFQFGGSEEKLIKDGRLVNPGWYATLCDGEGELLEKCNIIRGLHHLPLWTELPERE